MSLKVPSCVQIIRHKLLGTVRLNRKSYYWRRRSCLGIKEPDASTPGPHPPYCFPSPPDQDSVKGLAGMAVTTDFLCLSFHLEIVKESAGHRVCVGHGWSSPRSTDTGRRGPDAPRLCSPDELGEPDLDFSVSWFPLHRRLAS